MDHAVLPAITPIPAFTSGSELLLTALNRNIFTYLVSIHQMAPPQTEVVDI